MKRLLFVLLAVFLLAGNAMALDHYKAKVYAITDTGVSELERSAIADTIAYQVLAKDADTEETIYSDAARTAMTNPVVASVFATTDMVDFYCDSTTAGYVDLIVVDTNGGYKTIVEDFTPYVHSIYIDKRSGIVHQGMIWFSLASTTETDTGVDFLADTTIKRAYAEIVTTVAGGTVDLGLDSTEASGDADGLIDGMSTVTAEYPLVTLTTSGALMDDGTNFDPNGHTIVGNGTSTTAKTLTYKTNCTGGTAAGYFYWDFVRNR